MHDVSPVPEAVRAHNDRQDMLLLLIHCKDWWMTQLSAAMLIEAPGSHDARRLAIPADAMSILHPDDHRHPFAQATLCLDPANARWWIEGIDQRQGGCFFLSDSLRWTHLHKEMIA